MREGDDCCLCLQHTPQLQDAKQLATEQTRRQCLAQQFNCIDGHQRLPSRLKARLDKRVRSSR